MVKVKCVQCGEVFRLEDVSRPILDRKTGKQMGDFVWIKEVCPKCGKRSHDTEWFEVMNE